MSISTKAKSEAEKNKNQIQNLLCFALGDYGATNLIDMESCTYGCRLRTTDGEPEAFLQMDCSNYIHVIPGEKYLVNFSYYSAGNYGMAFYNASKEFVEGQKQSNTYSTSADYLAFVARPG